MAPLKITYLHYLYGSDTALHHVEQFASASTALGHQVSVHALNLGAPPSSSDGRSAQPSLANRLKQGLKPRLSRVLHEPKELYWNLR